MKVSLIDEVQGPASVLPPGSVVDLPDVQAKQLIDWGAAQPATEQEIAEAGQIHKLRLRFSFQ